MIKNDIYLIVGMLLIAGLCFVYFGFRDNGTDTQVTIRINKEECKVLSLQENREFAIEGSYGRNILIVSGEKAYMLEATCPDQLCVRQGSISRVGETIVCLPNRVVVEITGKETDGLDAVVK